MAVYKWKILLTFYQCDMDVITFGFMKTVIFSQIAISEIKHILNNNMNVTLLVDIAVFLAVDYIR